MVLRGSWWLLAVCLLSWCYNTWALGRLDPQAESPSPLVFWYEIGDIKVEAFIKFAEKAMPGIYVLPIAIGRSVVQDMENKALNASSEVCQILAKDPKLQQGYIAVTFSKRLQLLKDLAEKCQIPTMKDLISLSSRKFRRVMRRLSSVLNRP
uniref:palmitoyl-protein thioesterase 1-like n=1 Tax=Myodes glareolus TaxID=447135 RepID=UPI00201FBBFF|nr:palmitoyl-protein thioesterase 1-like [Myodes glareolus]